MAQTSMRITGEFLRQLLHLPVDTYISGSKCSSGDVILTVSHPDIPDGTKEVTPEFRKQDKIVFEGWGAKP